MKNQFLILISTLLLLSCGGQEKKKATVDNDTEIVENAKEQIDSLTTYENHNSVGNNIIERYFPEEKEIAEFDTIISESNLKISIQSKYLDSYVTNEFEIEGFKHIDKYRDSEKHLLIKKTNEILIDTVFKKRDFIELTGPEFLKIADFHGYWFNKIKNDTIELFGVISKPETDWSVAFYHYLDLRTKTFETKEDINEEI
ncbi:DUF4738 domain-containing protein [Aquimarina intermedia]|uniref:Uncharacterized protein DUF4738 n=1 Tax=Aquimarina intermedia TaxID=350814 RepID=A0A5S5BYU8_9FLAO|nr:DUF4738 domain-containing protein [Aquimarina intermedia]TYP72119.1 uncharacterized protein DUF4738 [Aquimarina intermedia]